MSLALVFVLCLSLCACGGTSQEDVAGAYVYASGVYDSLGDEHEGDNLLLHGDFTYDWGSEKGTYMVSRNKILLTNKYSSDVSAILVQQGDFCYVESSFEPIENDYGQTVTFSKEGRIAHEFKWRQTVNSKSTNYTLSLCEDGTFTLEELSSYDHLNYTSNVREGTYSLENNILTLTAGDVAYYFVCTEEGITKEVYKKYTAGTVQPTATEAPLPPIPDA